MPRKSIILYDIPGNATRDRAWSPNVWKARYVLNYKHLPYKTEWVDFHGIEALCKRTGAPPSMIRKNGKPFFTAPVIYDPSTDRYVSDSFLVAQYLERTYPETPRLFPPGTDALFALQQEILDEKVVRQLAPLMLLRVHAQLSPEAQRYFRRTREAIWRTKLEELAPPEKQGEMWKRVQAGLGQLDASMRANVTAKNGLFFMGNTLTYADVSVAGWLMWVKRIWGLESAEWKAIEEWHGGRWGKLMKALELWEYTDEQKSTEAK